MTKNIEKLKLFILDRQKEIDAILEEYKENTLKPLYNRLDDDATKFTCELFNVNVGDDIVITTYNNKLFKGKYHKTNRNHKVFISPNDYVKLTQIKDITNSSVSNDIDSKLDELDAAYYSEKNRIEVQLKNEIYVEKVKYGIKKLELLYNFDSTQLVFVETKYEKFYNNLILVSVNFVNDHSNNIKSITFKDKSGIIYTINIESISSIKND